MDERSPPPATTAASKPGEVVWERWTKKRTFVRALEGTYGELMSELFSQPRVYHTSDLKWKGGPQNFGKKVINPQAAEGRAVDRDAYRRVLAGRLRPEARPHEQRRVLRAQGQGPRHP